MNIPILGNVPGHLHPFHCRACSIAMRIILILLGAVFVYYGFKGVLEGLIMIPMGIAMIGVNAGTMVIQAASATQAAQTGNLFVDPLITNNNTLMNFLQINFLQPIFNFTFSNGLIPCLIFMGIGAITDIDFMIAKPFPSLMLAVAAEFGTVFTFPIAMAWGFNPGQAASISIVGGADGPMVLFTSLTLAKELFVPIAVIAYMYLALVYVGYPYLIKGLIPKKIQGTAMDLGSIPKVNKTEKLVFTISRHSSPLYFIPGGSSSIRIFLHRRSDQRRECSQTSGVSIRPVIIWVNLFPGFRPGSLVNC